MHRVIFTNTFYQALARLITSFVGFLITLIIARQFGVLGYGDFTKVTAFVSVFYLFVDFGLNAIFLKNSSRQFKDILSVRLVFAFALFLVCNLSVLFLPYDQVLDKGFSASLKIAVFIYSFSLFAQSILYSAGYYFQKKLNYLHYLLGVVGGALLSLILVFTFTFLNFSLFYVFIAFLFGGLVSSLIFFLLIKEEKVKITLNIKAYKQEILAALPLGLMLVFNFIYFRIDTVLLSILSDSNSVGVYGLAYKFFDFLIAIPLFLSNSIYPHLLAYRNNKPVFMGFVKKYMFVFLLLSILVIIPFWFASPLFSLIKPEFLESSIPFKVLLLSLPLFFLTSFLQWVLIALEKQKYLMYIYCLSLIINIVLNIIYIPAFSYMASAIITVLSEGIVLSLIFIKLIKERKYFNE